jgi:hypothetical protein
VDAAVQIRDALLHAPGQRARVMRDCPKRASTNCVLDVSA